MAELPTSLISLLRALDETQRETDEEGGAEVAWYYFRDKVEDVLGLDRGALDTGPDQRNPPCDEDGCGHPYDSHTQDREGYADGPCQILGCQCGDFV